MLKIKDNTIKSGYKGYWVEENYNYIDFKFNLNEVYDKYDIKFIVDNILKEEGYVLDFENVVYFDAEQVIYYNFDDRYSIEIGTFMDNEYTLSFVLKQFDNFDKMYELEYMRYLYNKIVNQIKADLVEKIEE